MVEERGLGTSVPSTEGGGRKGKQKEPPEVGGSGLVERVMLNGQHGAPRVMISWIAWRFSVDQGCRPPIHGYLKFTTTSFPRASA